MSKPTYAKLGRREIFRLTGQMPESAGPVKVPIEFRGETFTVIKNNPNQILNPRKVLKRFLKRGGHV